jgi:hypothetical protein
MPPLEFVDERNPVHRVSPAVYEKLVRAQQESFGRMFATAADLLGRALNECRISIEVPAHLAEVPPAALADLTPSELQRACLDLLRESVPEQTALHHANTLSERIHLLRAFERPDDVLARITAKVLEIVNGFPRTAADIECGRNPGDVLDPYILAATQALLVGGSFTLAVSAAVSHKAMMMIEGLLGHLHEDVIGDMRGNVRAPEPRGYNQEEVDPVDNPFPGADIVQPPQSATELLRFHQVKSKTGSAKGGDGKRLGEQLRRLQRYYRGEVFYDALIGNTLRGHRSRRGVEQVAPEVIILVGRAAFLSLTGSPVGPELLLRLYQAAFAQAAQQSGYRLEDMALEIVRSFEEKAEAHETDYLEVVLRGSIDGPQEDQDSRAERTVTRGGRQRRLPNVLP